MGYSGRDGGSEWMGVPPSRFKPKKGGNAVKGGFKLPKSKGANSAASRFGVDEGERPIRPAILPNGKRPQKRPRVGMGIMGGKGVLRKGR